MPQGCILLKHVYDELGDLVHCSAGSPGDSAWICTRESCEIKRAHAPQQTGYWPQFQYAYQCYMQCDPRPWSNTFGQCPAPSAEVPIATDHHEPLATLRVRIRAERVMPCAQGSVTLYTLHLQFSVGVRWGAAGSAAGAWAGKG